MFLNFEYLHATWSVAIANWEISLQDASASRETFLQNRPLVRLVVSQFKLLVDSPIR